MAKRSGWVLIACCLVAFLAGNVYAGPIVSFDVSGSSGDWTLDFSVTNTLGGSNYIYFFGVELPARDITGSPSGWNPNMHISWDNAGLGGSNITYNNVWINGSILDGQTLSGFEVHDTSATAPTSVSWFAFAYYPNGTYSGTDYFWSDINPGFEGTASVPLPPTVLLLGSGLLGLAGWRRFKKE
jgi:hypothetical protein